MPTHLYCLLPAGSDSAPPELADASAAVRGLRVGGIVAWVASTTEPRLTREGRRAADAAVRHDRIIAHALSRGVTPVPATLADPYPSDAALVDDVGSRIEEIVASLGRVSGAVEMAVILAPREAGRESVDQPAAPGGPGRQYLERQRDLPARLAAAADDIDERLRPTALASSRRADKDRVGLSHLVRTADVDLYRAIAVAQLSDRYRIVVDGPRAPYSFAAFSPRQTDAE
jgi:hypothetical protein